MALVGPNIKFTRVSNNRTDDDWDREEAFPYVFRTIQYTFACKPEVHLKVTKKLRLFPRPFLQSLDEVMSVLDHYQFAVEVIPSMNHEGEDFFDQIGAVLSTSSLLLYQVLLKYYVRLMTIARAQPSEEKGPVKRQVSFEN